MSDSESGKGDNDTTPQDVKEDRKEDQKISKKDESSVKENNKRTNAKKTKKEKEEVKEEDSEDSEDGEVGLLDKPLEVTGSRERKKVERLEVGFTTSKEKPEILKGSGENLGDIPRIEFQIQRASSDDLKVLHRLLFNRPGYAHEIRKNIRKFSGFTFAVDSSEHKKAKTKLEKLMIPTLKNQCEILDLEKGGTKEDKINRILDFLIKPQGSSRKVPQTKKRSAKGKGAKKKDKGTKKGAGRKRKSTDSEEEEDEVEEESEGLSEKESDEDKEVEEEQVVEEEEEEDMSDEEIAPKKKRGKAKAAPKKKPAPAKNKKEKSTDKAKKADDKKADAKTSKKRKVIDDSDNESSEDDDDAPLAKKSKSPPSDDEIKQLVKKILDDADLEEITMKKVIKQVFDEYPDFDLNDKKDFIKATVKSVIS